MRAAPTPPWPSYAEFLWLARTGAAPLRVDAEGRYYLRADAADVARVRAAARRAADARGDLRWAGSRSDAQAAERRAGGGLGAEALRRLAARLDAAGLGYAGAGDLLRPGGGGGGGGDLWWLLVPVSRARRDALGQPAATGAPPPGAAGGLALYEAAAAPRGRGVAALAPVSAEPVARVAAFPEVRARAGSGGTTGAVRLELLAGGAAAD